MSEREQIEQAIAALEAQRAALGAAVVDSAVTALREKLAQLSHPSPPSGRQRKQVTVLFADVSGFTAMTETMDAEDVNDMMNVLWRRLDGIITHHNGHVDKHMGDSVMALWGTGATREDDPEQAIRAALAIQAAMRQRNQAAPDRVLHLRIGLNTGPVLLGEIGTTGEFTAIGNTVNLAQRVQDAAPVDGILITHDTYRQVRGIFDVTPLPQITVKGRDEPLHVYQVHRAKPRVFRVSSRGVEGIETRMIGRSKELALLQHAYTETAELHGCRMISIVGEAGIGKSRLLYEFENWTEFQSAQTLYFKGRARPETQTMPYSLLRDLISFRFEIQESDDRETILAKLEAGFGEHLGSDGSGSRRQALVIGQLLGFDLPTSSETAAILGDPQQLYDRGLNYLTRFFRNASRAFPVALLLEDIHWADTSSLETIEHLLAALSDHPLLVIGLTRPILFERYPAWAEELPNHQSLMLQPLSREESRGLVTEILQKVDAIPQILEELVVDKSEGNPFYVEELIKVLIEDGVIIKDEPQWRIAPHRLVETRIPPTLTGILQTRLDGLPEEERNVLQRAAVLGPTFWDHAVGFLENGADTFNAEALDRILETLRGRELIFRRLISAFSGTQEYIFKHTLLRDVAYESVLKRDRPRYHGRAAAWLQDRRKDRVGPYTGIIAEHLVLGGQIEEARDHLHHAGEQAAAQFANAEALNFLSRALDLTPGAQHEARYALLLTREQVNNVTGDRQAQLADLEALSTLAEATRDDGMRRETALRHAHFAVVTGDYPTTITHARRGIHLAERTGSPFDQARGLLWWGQALWRRGEYEPARARLAEALHLIEQVSGPDDSARGATSLPDPRIRADVLRNLGVVHWFLGQNDKAYPYYVRSLEAYRSCGDQQGLSAALNNLGVLANDEGNPTEARDYYHQALAIKQEIGDRIGESIALNNLGTVAVHQGSYAAARGYFAQALKIKQEIGDRWGQAAAYGNLGEVSLRLGDYLKAQHYFEEALAINEEIGDRRGEGAVFGSLGMVAARMGKFDLAQTLLEKSLRIARELGHGQVEGDVLCALSTLAFQKGDVDAALTQGYEALQVARLMKQRHIEGQALAAIGNALAARGDYQEAAGTLRKALALYRESGQPHLEAENLAALAGIALAQGRRQEALSLIENVLDFLNQSTPDGAEDPFRIYWTCVRVLRDHNDPRAAHILETAYNRLQTQAAWLTDEATRQAMLSNIPAHRDIVRAWNAGHPHVNHSTREV
ncbi:MAG: tetratricopeptide repeat protein [Anaerolineae bacterium]|nr:tetratricopeptide repeat protein [Anaerolineae bacterium]